jgi:hypothetical protein
LLCKKKEEMGEKQLSRTFLKVYKRHEKDEREREMRESKKENENNNPFWRDPSTHRLLSHSDSQCANTLSECFTHVAKVMFIDTVN